MSIDDDDLRGASDMTSEDLHRELERLITRREPHWPDWLTRQGIYYHSDRDLDAETFTQACFAPRSQRRTRAVVRPIPRRRSGHRTVPVRGRRRVVDGRIPGKPFRHA
jgi:hypothetical protein